MKWPAWVAVAGCALIGLVSGCRLSDELRPTTFLGGNNQGVFYANPSVGNGVSPSFLLSKPISVEVANARPYFVVGPSFATRTDSTTQWAYFVIPITNVSPEYAFPFVMASDLRYLDSSGSVLSQGFAFVLGSVGDTGSSQTNTCLAPGETGMILDIEPDLYDRVAKVTFSIEYTVVPVTNPRARAIPNKLTYEKSGTLSSKLTVECKNHGTAGAVLQKGYHRYVVFDGQIPLGWAFMTDFVSPATVYPGATGTVRKDRWYHDGTADYVWVAIDFVDLASKSARARGLLPAFDSQEERDYYLKTVRDTDLMEQARANGAF